MSKNKKEWHANFLKYMDFIVNHPNYKGLAINRKNDGSLNWIATAESEIGKERIRWCEEKAKELNLEIKPGVYAEVMLRVHPTKKKICQTCGKEMSLYYHYPNSNFLKSLNKQFKTDFNECDHIGDIYDVLVSLGNSESTINNFLISKGELNISTNSTKDEVIKKLELVCRNGNKKCLGPGAMSNFPDRFDGFHTYNRCCRSKHDKGRSKENLKSYTKDRRAYEYWSDGNIHAANEFMGSPHFKGASADHIGPISLGFVHDPRYLQIMSSGDNSSKRDRLLYSDVEKIIEIASVSKIYPMSWYSKEIWEFIRENYIENADKVSTIYRDALKQNMSNFMFIIYHILISCEEYGKTFLKEAYLKPNFHYFDFTYEFDENGNIIRKSPRHFTERNANEAERYVRIAFESVYDYNQKDNRHINNDLTKTELQELNNICIIIKSQSKNYEDIKNLINQLVSKIEKRIIKKIAS